ncbi:MAG: 4-(cytidine 5'-diphospho)-2-C-methyl-D-erythritol kinase [Nitrospirae bacterium]|nr:4-(cytidine 5'-diphospho)-2-C-methyl-D-erythritol kinase [Nitrospirota bacterium]
MRIILRAPAKINWILSVVGKRADGYHEIVSPMQYVSIFDTLSFEKADEIELSSDLEIPVEENLVYRAAVLLKNFASYEGGARISLKKEIPAAAGLGGGSSDAAFTLIGLDRLWGLHLDEKQLMDLGLRIGSDVPFFMGGPFSIAEGRGERLTPLKTSGSLSLLLVKPPTGVSAAWAYSLCLPELTKRSLDIKLFCQALDRKDFASLRHMVFNDLEAGVIREYPVVAEIKKMLTENGAVLSSMSGSGPTVFGVFRSEEDARKASVTMKDYWCRIAKTLDRHERWES